MIAIDLCVCELHIFPHADSNDLSILLYLLHDQLYTSHLKFYLVMVIEQ